MKMKKKKKTHSFQNTVPNCQNSAKISSLKVSTE